MTTDEMHSVDTWRSFETDPKDPIIKAIPVFLSHKLTSQLALLQCPLRSSNLSGTPSDPLTRVRQIRYKPQSKLLECDISFDTVSRTFDRKRAEQWATGTTDDALAIVNRRGQTVSTSSTKSSTPVLETQTWRSIQIPLRTHYLVGAMDAESEELHFTPLQTCFQLRPSFDYVDVQDANQKKHAKKVAQTMQSEEDEADENGMEVDSVPNKSNAALAGKAVQLQIKRRETEEAAAARLKSFAHLQKCMQDEPWTPMQFVPDSAPEAESLYSDKMFVTTEQDRSVMICRSSSENYWNATTPTVAVKNETNSNPTSSVSGRLTMQELRKLPLAGQVKALMENTRIMQFSRLFDLLSPRPVMIKPVLIELEKVAVLIAGTWILKSECVYPKEEPLAANRNRLLLLFHEHSTLLRQDIAKQLTVNADQLREMLQEIAVPQAHRGWSLKVMPDERFLESVDAVLPVNQIQELKKRLQEQEERIKIETEVLSKKLAQSVAGRVRRTSIGATNVAVTMTSVPTVNTNVMPMTATNSSSNASSNASSKASSNASTNASTKSSSSSLDAILNVFRSHPVLTVSSLLCHLKLTADVLQPLLDQLIQQGSLSIAHQRLLLVRRKDEHDPYRVAIAMTFSEQSDARVRKGHITATLNHQKLVELNANHYRKLMTEFAEVEKDSGSTWILKSGNL